MSTLSAMESKKNFVKDDSEPGVGMYHIKREFD
jgi:hypothetical protein